MEISKVINKLRLGAKLSQEQFAEIFKVSRQSVQKWENATAVPEVSKLVEISKYFGISLDTLILNRDGRAAELADSSNSVKPNYTKLNQWELYSDELLTEYNQSMEEGLDIEKYKALFEAAAALPRDEVKKKLGDILFNIVINAKPREDYKYTEPSELEQIRALRKSTDTEYRVDKTQLEAKIHGAWLGRICGCLLGQAVEGIRTNELVPFLKETGNFPLHRYIKRNDLTDEICNKYNYPLASRTYADEINAFPGDDDTNYVLLAQLAIEKYGRDFTPNDMADIWIASQSRNAYFTAERVAYRNFLNGYEPPQSAVYKNPYREWIGAQIRGDYFGYINPGNTELAAEMAWRDASISHVKNGIYGEMFVAAMLAAAAATNDIQAVIKAGLAEIPYTSRLYEAVTSVMDGFNSGVTQQECFKRIHSEYDEYTGHGWCHTISNAMIVVAALLYGEGDYGKSICMAVETGFDTDCNGATVGSVLGMANGIESIPYEWTAPINDTLRTSISDLVEVKVSDRVRLTLEHIV